MLLFLSNVFGGSFGVNLWAQRAHQNVKSNIFSFGRLYIHSITAFCYVQRIYHGNALATRFFRKFVPRTKLIKTTCDSLVLYTACVWFFFSSISCFRFVTMFFVMEKHRLGGFFSFFFHSWPIFKAYLTKHLISLRRSWAHIKNKRSMYTLRRAVWEWKKKRRNQSYRLKRQIVKWNKTTRRETTNEQIDNDWVAKTKLIQS